MSAGVGRWRAMYTPGDWVLLSGPTSAMLLEPPPPERASMIEVLWEEILASSSMTELAGRLAAYPLDTLPGFAAFFWTAEGMRSLVRGPVSVIDLASGATVAEGEGIQTWSEVGLGSVDQVLVEVQTTPGTRQELPLVVGAVRASSLRLDASEAARVRSPQVPLAAAAPPPAREDAPAYAAAGDGYEHTGEQSGDEDPDDDETADTEESEVEPAEAREVEGADAAWAGGAGAGGVGVAGPGVGGLGVAGVGAGGGAAVLPPAPEPVAELPGPATELMPDPFTPDEAPAEWRPEDWPAEAWGPDQAADGPPADAAPEPAGADDEQVVDPADPEVEYPMWQPESEPAPARAMPPDGMAEMENADTQLMPPPASSPTESTGVSQNSLIMAVVCQYGHASAQNATTCRICGSPIAPQGPQLLPRPVLAVLRSSDGTSLEVDRAVLLGRAPSAQRSTARAPKLMTVPSPGHDISRTHLEVAPEGWSVVVTDLHSTNGTILIRPGGAERQPLPAGEPVPVELGSVVELGDGISVLIDFPQ